MQRDRVNKAIINIKMKKRTSKTPSKNQSGVKNFDTKQHKKASINSSPCKESINTSFNEE